MKEFYAFATANPELTFFCFCIAVWGIVEIIDSVLAPFSAPKTIIKYEKAPRTAPSDRNGKR